MTRTPDRGRLLLAATYALIGVVGLALPQRVPRIFGADAPTPSSRTEIRAVYGGIPLALAGSIMTGRPDAIGSAATASAGMAVARGVGMLVEPASRTDETWFFLTLEAVLAAGLWKQRGAARSSAGRGLG